MPYPHGCDRVRKMSVSLGIREGPGRRTVSPRPSHFSDFDLSRNKSASSKRCSECRDR